MNREAYKETGRKLRERRRQVGFSQKQTANYLRVSQKQPARYEKGRQKLNMNVLEKLAALYGCITGIYQAVTKA